MRIRHCLLFRIFGLLKAKTCLNLLYEFRAQVGESGKEQRASNQDDDDEEWDEVVDKTKIDKLKIVNLDNEMDDDMDMIIESKEAINCINKDELVADSDNADNSSNA